MRQQSIHIELTEYDRLDELSTVQVDLVNSAIEAAKKAYAPYSGYYVGAAALLSNGKTLTGNNQENAAYPSGLCAERVAIFYAGSVFPDLAVTSLAIAAIQDGVIQEDPVTPCGACRQVLCEKETAAGIPIEMILYGTGRIRIFRRAVDLLPLPFVLKK